MWMKDYRLFVLAYRAPAHDTTGLIPSSLVFGREPCLATCCLKASPDKKRPTIDHAANLLDHLHDIYNYDRQHLKLTGYRMKTPYDRLSNCLGYQVGDNVHTDILIPDCKL
jgi:hypothetical protein